MENINKHDDIAHAFLAAQRSMSNAIKGSANPYFKSKYADLNSVREAVMPALLEHGICVIQPEVVIDGRNYVRTKLIHADSDTSLECDVEIIMKAANDPQAQGSAITYARRYGLQSLCGIGAEDDDANRAAARTTPSASTPQQPAQQDNRRAFMDGYFHDEVFMDKIMSRLDEEQARQGDKFHAYNQLERWFAITDDQRKQICQLYNEHRQNPTA